MANRSVAIIFAIGGMLNWYYPGFNGFWVARSTVTAGEGEIVGAIFMVGAAILWFLRAPPQK